MTGAPDCAVLILSCDLYQDAWKPFFDLFSRYWKNNTLPVYLGINTANFEYPGVTVIHSGEPQNWTEDTRRILSSMKEKYVLVLLEDYFLTEPVDDNRVKECVRIMEEDDAVFTRMASFRADHFPMYAYDIHPKYGFMGVTRHSAPFLINLQAGIWNRSDFLSLLKDSESPWQFETSGSDRAGKMNRTFIGLADDHSRKYVHGPIPYLCTAITKGVWMREAVEICKREKIEIDLSRRPVESLLEYNKRRLYHSFSYGARKYIDYIAVKLRGKKRP